MMNSRIMNRKMKKGSVNMPANIKVYQENQIGGCITVINTEDTKIVIDFGESLPGCEVEEEYDFDWDKEKVDAVFFTHYHGDHIGRFMQIPYDVDLYMGDVTYKVLLNIRETLHDYDAVDKLITCKKRGKLHIIEENTPVSIGNDITVTAYSVDHSAYDAYMYYVEAGGTRILHTGDYRDHGHIGHVIKNGKEQNVVLDMIKYYVLQNGKRKVDVLITEGTMMGDRFRDERFSEKQLLAWADYYFKEHKYIFLKISSTNVDSLASFYQAAKNNGMAMYANGYILKQFRVYREAGRKHNTHMYDFSLAEGIPYPDKPGISEADRKRAEEKINKMKQNGFVMIVSEWDYYEGIMDYFKELNPEMIYSMWDGYIDPDNRAYNEKLAKFCKKHNAFSKHTSGHAYPELIEQVIKLVNPTSCIWPIHTENVDGFDNLDIGDELKKKIRRG